MNRQNHRLVKVTLTLICVTILLTILTGCTSSLVGKWEQEGTSNVWEFHSDGTLSTNQFRGEYSVVDGSHIRINQIAGGFGFEYEYELSGDTLTIHMDPYTYVLNRMK